MRCPYCEFDDTKVTDSRDNDDGIRRRRECLECGQRFTTIERVAAGEVLVAKKDGRREAFSREKLLRGLRKACEKRPLPAGTVEAVADAIEAALRQRGMPELPSDQVGELVMDHLRDLDHIAYIRFASVYREFADLEELQAELESLAANPPSRGGQASLLPEDQLKALTRGIRQFPQKQSDVKRPRGRSSKPVEVRGSRKRS
jgi:transcriptional repressor NrdR